MSENMSSDVFEAVKKANIIIQKGQEKVADRQRKMEKLEY